MTYSIPFHLTNDIYYLINIVWSHPYWFSTGKVHLLVFFLSFLSLPLHLVFTLSILEKFRYCLTLVINSIINCVWSGVQGKHLFIIVQILSMKLQEKWNKLYSFRPWWRKYGHIYLQWRLLNMAWCYYIWTEVETVLKEVSLQVLNELENWTQAR